MKIKNLKIKLVIILLLPFMLLLKETLYKNPVFTERVYSQTIYPPIGKVLSMITGIFPFSIAEVMFFSIVIGMVFWILRFIYRIFISKNKLLTTVDGFVNAACMVSILYCLFLLLWGFNYYRQPLAYSLGYTIEESTVDDLKALCAELIAKTNAARDGAAENGDGVSNIQQSFRQLAARSQLGYKNAGKLYPILGGSYGRAKGVMLSWQMCYTGIGGIYFPYTAEANVNIYTPDSLLPATTCHEMAHQRGFAREDEANFIAYLACKAHPDTDFQYSGYLLAAIHSMNALYRYDAESFKELFMLYSDGVKRDLKYHAEFWKQFEGPAEELQERINDTYLKSNKQADGVHSYGRMVDLLLAEFKTNNIK